MEIKTKYNIFRDFRQSQDDFIHERITDEKFIEIQQERYVRVDDVIARLDKIAKWLPNSQLTPNLRSFIKELSQSSPDKPHELISNNSSDISGRDIGLAPNKTIDTHKNVAEGGTPSKPIYICPKCQRPLYDGETTIKDYKNREIHSSCEKKVKS